MRRTLKNRHIAFVGLGSGIGVGIFIGIGSALANAGPAGLLIAFIITGMVVWTVMQCLGEIATLVSFTTTFNPAPADNTSSPSKETSPIMLLDSSILLWV